MVGPPYPPKGALGFFGRWDVIFLYGKCAYVRLLDFYSGWQRGTVLDRSSWSGEFMRHVSTASSFVCHSQVFTCEFSFHLSQSRRKYWLCIVGDKIRNTIIFGTDLVRNSGAVMTLREFRIRSVPNLTTDDTTVHDSVQFISCSVHDSVHFMFSSWFSSAHFMIQFISCSVHDSVHFIHVQFMIQFSSFHDSVQFISCSVHDSVHFMFSSWFSPFHVQFMIAE